VVPPNAAIPRAPTTDAQPNTHGPSTTAQPALGALPAKPGPTLNAAGTLDVGHGKAHGRGTGHHGSPAMSLVLPGHDPKPTDGEPGDGGQPPFDQDPSETLKRPKLNKFRSKELSSNVMRLSDNNPPSIRRIGRPPNTPNKWTPEYIDSVVADMQQYTDDTDYPTEAEFCYTRSIHPQRLRESPVLRDARDMMLAKRQAMVIRRGMNLGPGEGALGSFIARLSANAGIFSLVDKQEVTGNEGMPLAIGMIKRVIVDDAASAKRVEPEGEADGE